MERQVHKNIIVYIKNNFQIGGNKLTLIGSSSTTQFNYFSDYDFRSNIIYNNNPQTIKKDLTNILKMIKKNDDIYFIELKYQKLNNTKIKYYSDNEDILDNFNNDIRNIDYIKIDLIVYLTNEKIFKEVSINYHFNGDYVDDDNTEIRDIMEDALEQYKDENYFKYVKRILIIYITNHLTNENEKTKNIFKSDTIRQLFRFVNNQTIGEISNKLGELKALQLLKKKYNEKDHSDKFNDLDLKDINENKLDDTINKYQETLNSNAKKLLDEFKDIQPHNLQKLKNLF